jgi:adenylate kinase
MSAPAIVLFGPPGSGKGTQAERLRDELGFVALSTGDLLRRACDAGTDLGRQAGHYMARGDLVPDDVVAAVMRDAIGDLENRPILLDGYPRNVAQADALGRALEERGRQLTDAVFIDVPDDVVADRIAARDHGRPDDDPETVRERLRVYHRETEPLIDYYAGRGLLRRVDGAREPDRVHDGVLRGLGHRPA